MSPTADAVPRSATSLSHSGRTISTSAPRSTGPCGTRPGGGGGLAASVPMNRLTPSRSRRTRAALCRPSTSPCDDKRDSMSWRDASDSASGAHLSCTSEYRVLLRRDAMSR